MSDLQLTSLGFTHAELVRRARMWLSNRMHCRFVLCETQAGTGESPDAIGWKYGDYSHLVEVKVSRSDFFADHAKPFRQQPERGVGIYRWLMVPAGLVSLGDMAAYPGWGLLEVVRRSVRVVRKAERQPVVNREAEVCVLVQAVANAQLCAPMDLNEWFSHPETAVGRMRANRRRIADQQREIALERSCGGRWDVVRQQMVRCDALVATGYCACSEHGGRTRGEKRKQADVERAYFERGLEMSA